MNERSEISRKPSSSQGGGSPENICQYADAATMTVTTACAASASRWARFMAEGSLLDPGSRTVPQSVPYFRYEGRVNAPRGGYTAWGGRRGRRAGR
jgi:hypothetical protein